MPKDSTPRILPFLIVNVPPSPSGKTVPMVASGTMFPASQFGAPQTIWSVSEPVKTSQMERWSEFSCLRRERIFATITPSGILPTVSISSTSSPAMVSALASSSGERLMSI